MKRLEDRISPSITLSGVPTWVNQGPGPILGGQAAVANGYGLVSGAIQAIAADPTNANRVFVGTVNGGIWRTTNATASNPTWTPLTDFYPSLSIGAIAFSPLDPKENTLFAGIGLFSNAYRDRGSIFADGLLKTTDGGAHWSLVKNTFPFNDIFMVTSIVPTSLVEKGQVILVAANVPSFDTGGVWRSNDGGATFTNISGSIGSGLPYYYGVSDLIADPGDSYRFYAALPDQGIYVSNDGGKTWSAVNNGITGLAGSVNIKLAIHNDPTTNAIYAAVVGSNGQLSGVFRSTNQGSSWVAMDLPGTIENGQFVGINTNSNGAINLSLVADPANANVVYIGGEDQAGNFPNSSGCTNYYGMNFRGDASLPSGSQWSSLDCNGANGTAPHADSRAMVFDANGNLLEADDGGIYRLSNPSNPLTRVWTSVNGNIDPTEFYSVAYDSVNHTVFGGAQDVGSPEQHSPGGYWYDANQGDGGFAQVDNTSSPGYSIHYTTAQYLIDFQRQTFNSYGSFASSTFVQLIVNGTNGQTLSQYDPTLQFFTPYVLNSVQPTRMLIGTNNLYESFDQGDHLNFVTNFGQPITALAYGGVSGGVANPDVAYVGAGNQLWLRTTAGGSFTQIASFGNLVVKAIALDPTNWQTAYVTDWIDVWQTTDAGSSWTKITGNLWAQEFNTTQDYVGTARSITVYKTGTTTVVLVGTQDGLYRTINPSGASTVWTQFGTNLPTVTVMDVHYDPTDDVLVVGTLGRGVWTVAHASNYLATPGTLQINGDTDFSGENDTIRLVRDPFDPLLLDVYLNNTSSKPNLTVKLAALQNISVDGLGGTNSLIVDDSDDPFLPYSFTHTTLSSGTIDGMFPVPVSYVVADLSSLILYTSKIRIIAVDVDSTSSGVPVTFNLGSTSLGNGVLISISSGLLDNIQGNVTINGGGAVDSLYVSDYSDLNPQTYTLTSSTITRTGSALIRYKNIGYLEVDTGQQGGISFNVLSTAANTLTNIYVLGGTANGYADQVQISPFTQNLDGIQGQLTITETIGTIIVNDQAKNSNVTYTITSSTIKRSGSALITYNFGDSSDGLGINTGSGNDTVNVESTGAEGVALFLGNGNNTVNLSPVAKNLDNLGSVLDVYGGSGSNTLIMFDQANANNDTYLVGNGYISRDRWPGAVYSGGSISAVLDAGSGTNTIDVSSTQGGPVTVNAGTGNDQINVGDANNTLNEITSPLTVNGQGGTNTLDILDQGDSNPDTFTLTSRSLGCVDNTWAVCSALTTGAEP